MCDDLDSMMLEFDMSDLGKIRYFLEVIQMEFLCVREIVHVKF